MSDPISKPTGVLAVLEQVLVQLRFQIGHTTEVLNAVKDTRLFVRAGAALSILSMCMIVFCVIFIHSAVKKLEQAETKLALIGEQLDSNIAATKVVEKAAKETNVIVEEVKKNADESAKVTLVPDHKKPAGVRVVIVPPKARDAGSAPEPAKIRPVEVSGKVIREEL